VKVERTSPLGFVDGEMRACGPKDAASRSSVFSPIFLLAQTVQTFGNSVGEGLKGNGGSDWIGDNSANALGFREELHVIS